MAIVSHCLLAYSMSHIMNTFFPFIQVRLGSVADDGTHRFCCWSSRLSFTSVYWTPYRCTHRESCSIFGCKCLSPKLKYQYLLENRRDCKVALFTLIGTIYNKIVDYYLKTEILDGIFVSIGSRDTTLCLAPIKNCHIVIATFVTMLLLHLSNFKILNILSIWNIQWRLNISKPQGLLLKSSK